MSDFLRLVVIFFAAINPAAVALAARDLRPSTREAAPVAAAAFVIAAVLFGIVTWAADPLLDWLDVAPETFRIAAGIVMMTYGVLALAAGRWSWAKSEGGWQDALFPVAIPLLASPAGLVAAMSYGVDEGEAQALGAALLILAVAAGLVAAGASRKFGAATDAIARITGAILVVVAAGLIVEGVRDI